MIVVMKPEATKNQVELLKKELLDLGMDIQVNQGTECVVLGVLGDVLTLDTEKIELNNAVERVMRVSEPFKKANRKFHPADSVVDVNGVNIGGGTFTVIAGPCSVESEAQILEVAEGVKQSGAGILRGGAFKPRTSPYAFQGMEFEGLALLEEARAKTGLPIISEIMSPKHVERFDQSVDIIQVGARNMQNFDLLKELGKCTTPVMLKRGLSATIEEWLMSAEYIMAGGNENVILCERGIRTFETYTRNTLDLAAVPAVKRLSHLPVIVDPSHATGMAWMVEPLAMAAAAVGADGLMVEVHNDPPRAKCDGKQSITPAQFEALMQKLDVVVKAAGKEFSR